MLLRVEDAARLLKVSRVTVWRWLKSGRLRSLDLLDVAEAIFERGRELGRRERRKGRPRGRPFGRGGHHA